MLKSQQMNLSQSEKIWLPYFGKTGRLAMGWACYLNKWRYPILEEIFASIAATRVRILTEWTEQKWSNLTGISSKSFMTGRGSMQICWLIPCAPREIFRTVCH